MSETPGKQFYNRQVKFFTCTGHVYVMFILRDGKTTHHFTRLNSLEPFDS